MRFISLHSFICVLGFGTCLTGVITRQSAGFIYHQVPRFLEWAEAIEPTHMNDVCIFLESDDRHNWQRFLNTFYFEKLSDDRKEALLTVFKKEVNCHRLFLGQLDLTDIYINSSEHVLSWISNTSKTQFLYLQPRIRFNKTSRDLSLSFLLNSLKQGRWERTPSDEMKAILTASNESDIEDIRFLWHFMTQSYLENAVTNEKIDYKILELILLTELSKSRDRAYFVIIFLRFYSFVTLERMNETMDDVFSILDERGNRFPKLSKIIDMSEASFSEICLIGLKQKELYETIVSELQEPLLGDYFSREDLALELAAFLFKRCTEHQSLGDPGSLAKWIFESIDINVSSSQEVNPKQGSFSWENVLFQTIANMDIQIFRYLVWNETISSNGLHVAQMIRSQIAESPRHSKNLAFLSALSNGRTPVYLFSRPLFQMKLMAWPDALKDVAAKFFYWRFGMTTPETLKDMQSVYCYEAMKIVTIAHREHFMKIPGTDIYELDKTTKETTGPRHETLRKLTALLIFEMVTYLTPTILLTGDDWDFVSHLFAEDIVKWFYFRIWDAKNFAKEQQVRYNHHPTIRCSSMFQASKFEDELAW